MFCSDVPNLGGYQIRLPRPISLYPRARSRPNERTFYQPSGPVLEPLEARVLLSAGWNDLTLCLGLSESENLGQSAADQVPLTRHDGGGENSASYPADLKGLIETAPTDNSLDHGWSSEHPDGLEESASKLWPRELVFVDAGIHDYQYLLDDLLACGQDGRQIQVVVLDSNLDGIAQISQVSLLKTLSGPWTRTVGVVPLT